MNARRLHRTMTWVVSFSMLRPFGPRRLTADQALRHPWFMVGDHELISRNLAKTLDTMKKFNAKRKFKGKVKGIILANRLAKGDLF